MHRQADRRRTGTRRTDTRRTDMQHPLMTYSCFLAYSFSRFDEVLFGVAGSVVTSEPIPGTVNRGSKYEASSGDKHKVSLMIVTMGPIFSQRRSPAVPRCMKVSDP